MLQGEMSVPRRSNSNSYNQLIWYGTEREPTATDQTRDASSRHNIFTTQFKFSRILLAEFTSLEQINQNLYSKKHYMDCY